MSELNLPECPICGAQGSLSRQTMEGKRQSYIWYECRACASVLLSIGNARWMYQKVGREEKLHLLQQHLTIDDLQRLVSAVNSEVFTLTAKASNAEGGQALRKGPAITRIVPWLLVLCLIGFLALVLAAVSQSEMIRSWVLAATAIPQATHSPAFAPEDEVRLAKPTGGNITLWQMKSGCQLENVQHQIATGERATVGQGMCYHTGHGEYYYHVESLNGTFEGWVRGGEIVSHTAYTPPPPTSTARPTIVPTPRPRPITLQGRGQEATGQIHLPSPISIARFTHSGQRNFIVTAYMENREELLINTIGPYQGERPLWGEEPVVLDIDADGSWTVEIRAVGYANSPAYSGRGDAVSELFDPPGTGAWEIQHSGERNFIVLLHCAGGTDLVQNEIGSVRNSTMIRFAEGPCLWEVEADGPWSLMPRN